MASPKVRLRSLAALLNSGTIPSLVFTRIVPNPGKRALQLAISKKRKKLQNQGKITGAFFPATDWVRSYNPSTIISKIFCKTEGIRESCFLRATNMPTMTPSTKKVCKSVLVRGKGPSCKSVSAASSAAISVLYQEAVIRFKEKVTITLDL